MISEKHTQNLAEKIANLLQNESQNSDFSSLQKSIEKINQRLDGIENKLDNNSLASQLSILHSKKHPSQNKYNVIEAIVDEVFENTAEEKACTFEPNGKPCDHCSMCNSHGF
jgi:predicted nucleotide-binding protein (sugar kinase/HSP70/actin superfamily)